MTRIKYPVNRRRKPSLRDTKSLTTIQILLPIWCSNISDNIPYIKKYGSISKLICKSYPECWKINKLKEFFYSKEEHEIEHVKNQCELSSDIIFQSEQLCLSRETNLAGTDACENCIERLVANRPALIIGNGPSLDTYSHLDALQKYGFNGDIFCVSAAAKKVLEKGIIPKYIISIDAEEYESSHMNHAIINKYSDKITGIFSTSVNPITNNVFKGDRVFMQGYMKDDMLPNVSHILYLLTKVPSISTCGNVGSTGISIASSMQYNPIILIGMDLSFPSLEDMSSYYDKAIYSWNPNKKEIKWGSGEFKYKIMKNPDFNKEYYVNSIFEMYKTSTIQFINGLLEYNIKTINCSEQGSIHGKNIIPMKFEEYLKSQK